MLEISRLEADGRRRRDAPGDGAPELARINSLHRRHRLLEREHAALEQVHADLEIALAEARVDRPPDAADESEVRRLRARTRELEDECATLEIELRTARAYGGLRSLVPSNGHAAR